MTPKARGILAPDISLAREFGLFAHVVPIKNIPGVKTRHENVDLVVIRENTEGEYSGLEHEVTVCYVERYIFLCYHCNVYSHCIVDSSKIFFERFHLILFFFSSCSRLSLPLPLAWCGAEFESDHQECVS